MPRTLLLVMALLLAACGEEQPTPGPTPVSGATLFVRAEGMVQSLGIT